MRYNEKYFEHVKDCKCDIEKVKETMEAAVSRRSPWEIDKDGAALFYCDSFGYRGQIPGETKECYQAMSEIRKKASSIPDGCTCCYSSNGVLDSVEPDCSIHEEVD
ncbi:hypothetical protein LCGC14_0764310 [marine sediment metagenome]|uniref:Uncharacterized protein n=1 Tax=marine sediment metagenome TaxID=412755 RepID=A0A0F9QK27_9ZZZZ